jgi:outer membrane protein TolC
MNALLTNLLVTTVLGTAAGGAGAPLTLDQALARAHQANARLPVAALDPRIAEQRVREAQARRRITLSTDGDLWIAPGNGYDPVVTDRGDERLQVVAEKTVYDGGALRGREHQARSDVRVAEARYRQAVADVDLEVRDSFARLLAARGEVEVRQKGLGRLRHYVNLLEQRVRAGQPLASDLLSARVRMASDSAALADARGRVDDARAALDVLMGSPPDAPLVVAALPPPAPPSGPAAAETAGEAAEKSPGEASEPSGPSHRGSGDAELADVAAARQAAESAGAGLTAARAERSPVVTLRADAGLWGSDPLHAVPSDLAARHPGATFGDRLKRDAGYSLMVDVHLPLFDTGGVAARIAQAELSLEQARRSLDLVRTEADLQREQARRALASAYEQYQTLSAAIPVARDAYLDAESRYWGGTGTYLQVLDAFSTAVDTAVQQAQAALAYREAEARVLRWGGTP